MANYELTVSMGYVPTWTHVDAVREIFQNAKDEETVNPENKMFFDYNEETETLMIGNKTGKLNKSTLLIGISDKRNDNRTIGQHGEGYKIATVVLLREGLSLKIYNFGCNEVWTAKKIKSRRYGVDIPAFDIQKAGSLLRPVANHDLVFEIQGITAEMYEEILESNLYLQEREGLLGEVMQANNSRMHFTDNDKEKLKENKRMIIEWITENIIPNMDEDSQIKCDFGDTYRCPRTYTTVESYHFWVFSEPRKFFSGGGRTTDGTIGYGRKFGYMDESFESVNSPYDIFPIVDNWGLIKATLLNELEAQKANRRVINQFEV